MKIINREKKGCLHGTAGFGNVVPFRKVSHPHYCKIVFMAKSQRPAASSDDAGHGGYDADLLRLVERSGFIFRGRPVGRTGSAGAGQEPSQQVLIEEVLLSSAALRNVAGREAAFTEPVETTKRKEENAVFFSTVISLGNRLVLRSLGELPAFADQVLRVKEYIRVVGERPFRERIAAAELIITGKVAETRPNEKPRLPRSEHDPDWWIARVKVEDVHKGATKHKEVEVLFANSRDIAWYKSPKLHAGDRGIFLLQPIDLSGLHLKTELPIYQVVDPLDFHPIDRLSDIQKFL
jgi:hypothetical protein